MSLRAHLIYVMGYYSCLRKLLTCFLSSVSTVTDLRAERPPFDFRQRQELISI